MRLVVLLLQAEPDSAWRTATQPTRPPPALQQEAVGHEMLVDLLLRELLVCAALDVPKPYLAALCRTAASLEVFPVGEAEGGVSSVCRPSRVRLHAGLHPEEHAAI